MNGFKSDVGRALLTLSAGIILASFFYGDSYSFITEPVSSLGRIATQEGRNNVLSHIIFAAACTGTAFFLLSAFRRIKNPSLLLMFAGMLLLPAPCDRFPQLHQAAAAAAVGGAWLFCTSAILKGSYPLRDSLLFQPSVIVYAVMHIAGSQYKEEFQTLALIAVAAGLLAVSGRHERANRKKPAEDYSRRPCISDTAD